MDCSHLLRTNSGLGACVLREGVCLDGGVGPSDLSVHLKVYHRCGNRWGGRAAFLHGQECKRRDKVRSKDIGTIIGPRRGTFVGTHVSMRTVECVYGASSKVHKMLPRSRGYQALSRCERYTSILDHYQEMVVVRGKGGCDARHFPPSTWNTISAGLWPSKRGHLDPWQNRIRFFDKPDRAT